MFETGIGIRNPLFFVGIVENNNDPRYEARVQVRAFGVHGTKDQIPTEDLPWALVVAGNYNLNTLPQQNHWVFGVFLDGRDAQQPLVLGTIPTFMNSTLDPDATGVGQRPRSEDERVQSADSAPERVGQPQNHPLSRGEYIQEQYPLEQELNRVRNIRVGSNPSAPNEDFSAWSEPGTAYNTRYPHNRVYDSPDGKTTIELDSTPSSERLMVWHRGSFIQIDSNGTRTDKSYSDHYEVNDRNNMVYVGGRNSVTIMGDSHVYVDGNKIEEINGDLVQIVHCNHILSVGGQSTINASDEVQIRGGQIRMESNVSGINLKAAKGLFAQTGESMHFKSGIAIFQEATNSMNIKAGDNIYIQCDTNLNIKTENTNIEATEIINIKADDVRLGGGADVSIRATDVAIDDRISMANNDAAFLGEAQPATEANPAASVEAPEPPAKSTTISSNNSGRNRPNIGTAGAGAVDDPVESTTTSETNTSAQSVTPKTSTGTPSPGINPEKAAAIRKLAEKYGINPNALAGILSIESNFDPNIQGGAGNNYYGIFQLQGSQIAGLTQQVFGRSLSIDEYRNLSFDDQLKVYEQYITNAGASKSFFTGDERQDASRLWALQLAPSNARSINYNDPNAVISRTNQANNIEAREGLVTVGSVQNYTVSRGNLS